MSYATMDHLAALVLHGPGALLVKANVMEAYRMISVHPDDHHLLGIRWWNAFFIDSVLPFGLRSAPKIFSAVADAAQWIMAQAGIKHSLHYLDDFILVEGQTGKAMESRQILERSWVYPWNQPRWKAQVHASPSWALKSTLFLCSFACLPISSHAYA